MTGAADTARMLEQVPGVVTADALLLFTLKATVVLAVAWMVVRLLRGRSAALRHAVWTSAVVSVLALPALGILVPQLSLGAWPATRGETVGPSADVMGPAMEPAGLPADPAAHAAEGKDAVLRQGPGVEGGDPASDRGHAGADGAVAGAVDALYGGRIALGAADDLVLLGWLGGALVVLALLALEGWWLARLRRRGRAAAASEIEPMASDAAHRLGLRSLPPVHVCDGLDEPVAWGILRPRVMLPAGFGGWSSRRRESVLLHELAHVRRRDVAWQTAATLLCAVQWFNPLAWIAARRMREERERACDDEVLSAGASPVRYASALLELAREAGGRRSGPLAATSMAGTRGLPGRIEAVLEPERSRPRATGPLAGGLGAVGLAAALPLAALGPAETGSTAPPPGAFVETKVAGPEAWTGDLADGASVPASDRSGGELAGQETPICWRGDRSHRSEVRIHEEERAYRVRRRTEDCTATIVVRGEIGFDAEYARIVRLSPGALVEIEERLDDGVTRLRAVAGADGRPAWQWRVDGEERPFDDARAWLRARVPVLLRFTGIQAAERAAWLYGRGGIDGLLDEIPRLRGDAIQRRYLEAHVRSDLLSAAELDELLVVAGDALGSDHEMRRVLVGVAESLPRALSSGPAREAFWRAARTVGSDREHGRMLLAAAEAVGEDPRFLGDALASVRRSMGSDREAGRLLLQLAVRFPDVEADRPGPFWAAVATIGSDGEHRRLLDRLAEILGPEPERLVRLLDSAADGIGSDGEMAGFLVRLTRRYPASMDVEPVRTALVEAAATVGSDGERRRVDRALERRRGI